MKTYEQILATVCALLDEGVRSGFPMPHTLVLPGEDIDALKSYIHENTTLLDGLPCSHDEFMGMKMVEGECPATIARAGERKKSRKKKS